MSVDFSDFLDLNRVKKEITFDYSLKKEGLKVKNSLKVSDKRDSMKEIFEDIVNSDLYCAALYGGPLY